ncbi:hypothetical protein ACFQX6_47480 [Streptosporangium lutulentum]
MTRGAERDAVPAGRVATTGVPTTAGGSSTTGVPTTAGGPSTTGDPSTGSGPELAALGPMAATSTTDLRIPGTRITLRENPSDPEWVTSYEDRRDESDGSPTYLRRSGSAEFRFVGGIMTVVTAPGGERAVVNPNNKFLVGEFDLIRVVDPAGGAEVQIRTVDAPLNTFDPHWDRNGTRILLTVYEGLREEQRSKGFVIVDVASRTARVSPVPDEGPPSPYAWGPDPDSVMHAGLDGSVRFHRLDGSVLRTVPGVGEMTANDARSTPLGTVFTTFCPDRTRDVCLWDASTAARKATVPIREGMRFGGLVGDRHLLATVTEGKTMKVVLLDLRGEVVRVLADGPAAEFEKVVLRYSPK